MTRLLPLSVVVLVLSGCWGPDETELRQWMDEVRKQAKLGVQPLPEPKRFVPRPYESRATIDPFDPARSVVALDREKRARASASAVRPDLDRQRDPLESIPLEQIRMVGYLRSRAGSPIGLIDPGTGTTQVRIGQYMGQNFGLVTDIRESEIVLKEIVQDASGEWIERPARLELLGGNPNPSAGGKR